MNDEQFEDEQIGRDNAGKVERDNLREALARVEAERDKYRKWTGDYARQRDLAQAQLSEAAHLMQETERVLRIGDGYGWEDRLANNLVAFLARYAQAENELCIDEGCPNHGTAHICVNRTTQGTLKNTGRFSEEGDSRTNPDGSISTLVDNGDGSLGVTTTNCPKLHPLYLDHVNGCITGKNPAQGEQSGDDEQPECFCVEHGLHIETLKAQLEEAIKLIDQHYNDLGDACCAFQCQHDVDVVSRFLDVLQVFLARVTQAEQQSAQAGDEALRKDAERYRHLRDMTEGLDVTVDAMIAEDAAMRAQAGKEKS